MDVVIPQVVAHRGASHDNAEHTLRAYVAALDAGAEALECDVRLTSDGHLVCVHDRDLRRTASSRAVVSNTELAELDQLDFHSWKNPWAELAIETKHPTRYGGLVERRLVDQLRHLGWDRPGSPARVMSFSWTALQRVERLAPDVPLVMLLEHSRTW